METYCPPLTMPVHCTEIGKRGEKSMKREKHFGGPLTWATDAVPIATCFVTYTKRIHMASVTIVKPMISSLRSSIISFLKFSL